MTNENDIAFAAAKLDAARAEFRAVCRPAHLAADAECDAACAPHLAEFCAKRAKRDAAEAKYAADMRGA